MALLLAIGVFLGLMLAFGALSAGRWLQWRADQRVIARRIGRRPSERGGVLREQDEDEDEQLALAARLPALQRVLLQAGSPAPLSLVLLSGLALAGLAVFVGGRLVPGPLALGGVAFGAVPWIGVLALRRRRARIITALLPKAVEHMITAIRAGQSLPDAFRAAGANSQAPLRAEFLLVADEARLGLPLRGSLQDMMVRLPEVFELRMLVAAVLLNQETGGNLNESLGHVVVALRERRVYVQRLRAFTSEARTSAIVLGVLPVIAGGGLFAFAPSYLAALLEPSPLRTLFLACLAWMGVGLLVMGRIAAPGSR